MSSRAKVGTSLTALVATITDAHLQLLGHRFAEVRLWRNIKLTTSYSVRNRSACLDSLRSRRGEIGYPYGSLGKAGEREAHRIDRLGNVGRRWGRRSAERSVGTGRSRRHTTGQHVQRAH